MTSQRAEKYRSLAGRLVYHSFDDPRVQIDTGLVMRGMSTPRVLDQARLHRVVRYIAGAPRVDWLRRWQGCGEASKLCVLADADHAVDDESRRSVSCSREFLEKLGHKLALPSVLETASATLWPSTQRGPSSRGAWSTDLVSLAWKDRQPTQIPQRRGCIVDRKCVGKLKHPLVTAGTGGRTGESRQDRLVAEHGRRGHQVFGRGAAEAADWDAASART